MMWVPDLFVWEKDTIWTSSSEFGTYHLCKQRRFRRACASAQSYQNLRCSLIQAVSQEEPSDRKPDPWPLWMAGHAQLKFIMTECSKTQIRLTGLISLIKTRKWEGPWTNPWRTPVRAATGSEAACPKHLRNMSYRNVPQFSDRQVWANSVDPDQTTPLGIYTVCQSVCIFWTHYSTVKPSC